MTIFKTKPAGMPEDVWKQVRKLKNKKWLERWSAVYALGQLKNETAIPYLTKALKDENKDIRWHAVEALGEIGSENSIPHLIKALEDKEESVRNNAAEALGKIGSENSIPALIETLKDKNYNVMWRAVEALNKILAKMKNKPKTKQGKALLMVGKHFRKNDKPNIILTAYRAALEGKINEENALNYIQQLKTT